jgi:hypothetical protein
MQAGWSRWLIVVVALPGVATYLATPAVAGSRAFSGNVCAMVSAAQVSALKAPKTCKPATLKSAINTAYYGTWAASSPMGPHLTVSIVAWKNSALLAAARSHLNILPGPSKKVAGIGSAAYESSAGQLTAINFVVGSDICDINLRTAKPLGSLTAFNALAKQIASKL